MQNLGGRQSVLWGIGKQSIEFTNFFHQLITFRWIAGSGFNFFVSGVFTPIAMVKNLKVNSQYLTERLRSISQYLLLNLQFTYFHSGKKESSSRAKFSSNNLSSSLISRSLPTFFFCTGRKKKLNVRVSGRQLSGIISS